MDNGFIYRPLRIIFCDINFVPVSHSLSGSQIYNREARVVLHFQFFMVLDFENAAVDFLFSGPKVLP